MSALQRSRRSVLCGRSIRGAGWSSASIALRPSRSVRSWGDAEILGLLNGDASEDAQFFALGGNVLRLWESKITTERLDRLRQAGHPLWMTSGGKGTARDVGDFDAESLSRSATVASPGSCQRSGAGASGAGVAVAVAVVPGRWRRRVARLGRKLVPLGWTRRSDRDGTCGSPRADGTRPGPSARSE